MVWAGGIFYTLYDFEDEIWGMVYKCSRGHYHIGINKNLTKEKQEEILQHELKHIKNHCPKFTYFIGINMQYSKIEKEAG